jgi:SCO1/SenC
MQPPVALAADETGRSARSRSIIFSLFHGVVVCPASRSNARLRLLRGRCSIAVSYVAGTWVERDPFRAFGVHLSAFHNIVGVARSVTTSSYKLGRALGSRVSFVPVTVDPEHDRPSRLLDYARAFNANVKGWYFLTGSTAQIDQLMKGFRLTRERESDGEFDHVLGYFLVGTDGSPDSRIFAASRAVDSRTRS